MIHKLCTRALKAASARNGRTALNRQRGGSAVELALATMFLYAPLLVGLVVIGIAAINRIQLEQLTRDVGIMHARGLDFTGAQNKALFLKLTQGSPFIASTGVNPKFNGTIVVSTIRKLGSADCSTGCANLGYPVVTYRTVLGDPALYTSWLATPGSIDSSNGRVNNYKNDSSARATAIENLLPSMLSGEEAYVAEGYMTTPGFSFPDVNATAQVKSYAIF